MNYDAILLVQHEGFVHIEQQIKLPPADRRLLIIMKAGQDNYKPESDIVNDTIREGERIEMLPRH